jgi:hypothetical protein
MNNTIKLLERQLAALNIEKFLLWANRSDPAFLRHCRDGWMKLHMEECHLVRRLRENLKECQDCADTEGLYCDECERKLK